MAINTTVQLSNDVLDSIVLNELRGTMQSIKEDIK